MVSNAFPAPGAGIMDSSLHVPLVIAALVALGGAVGGVWVGVRLARSRRRELSRRLAERELALLDARAETDRATRVAALEGRRGAALRLALKRQGLAEARARAAAAALEALRRSHYREMAALRLSAAESRDVARRAAALARGATAHLKRLEAAAPAVQTIVAHEPKSYGVGGVHTVRVVDQSSADARRDAVSRVSNRDSARFARLAPSNEPRRAEPDDLKVIDGISPAVERRLREAGIQRIDQLANLSDAEADALDRELRRRHGVPLSTGWQHGARELLGRRPGA